MFLSLLLDASCFNVVLLPVDEQVEDNIFYPLLPSNAKDNDPKKLPADHWEGGLPSSVSPSGDSSSRTMLDRIGRREDSNECMKLTSTYHSHH